MKRALCLELIPVGLQRLKLLGDHGILLRGPGLQRAELLQERRILPIPS
jgi:hypothetical protein